MNTDDLEIRTLAFGHLPLIRACIDQLGIMDMLDAHLPRHPLAKASDAECVAVRIFDDTQQGTYDAPSEKPRVHSQ
jgi:hypothetical protein